MQPGPAHVRFWDWFRASADRLAAAMYGPDNQARQRAADELGSAIGPVVEGVILEIGGVEPDGTRPLIASADGRPELVDAVKDFVASAPTLPGWKVVAFRTRFPVGDMAIVLQGERVSPDDVWFRVAEEDDGLALRLYVRDLTPTNRRLRGLGATLLAQHAVGEQDTLTLLASLDVEPLPAATDGLCPLRELVAIFDEAKARRYPPPGSLTLAEGGWLNMTGMLNGVPASILLDAGLKRLAGHPAYDRRLTVSLPYQSRPDGMPASSEEHEAVSTFGDRLAAALQAGQQSLLALTLTTAGHRDLIFYTAHVGPALLRLEDLRTPTARRFKASFERDSFWSFYRRFLSASEEGKED